MPFTGRPSRSWRRVAGGRRRSARRVLVDRRRADRRPPAAGLEGRAARGARAPGSTSRPACTTSCAADPDLVAAADGARARAARPARGAARPPDADRRRGRRVCRSRVVHTVGSDCAIGKMTRRARARAGGPRGRPRGGVRADRPDRRRHRGVGDRRRPRRRRLRRRRRRAPRHRGRRARRPAVRRGAGRAYCTRPTPASRSACCTASRAARAGARPPGRRRRTS